MDDVPKPRLETRNAFRVVGLSVWCGPDGSAAIPALWTAFNDRVSEVANPVGPVAYGVCHDGGGQGGFRYLAGIEATGETQGMDFVDIPANRYAVFTHDGRVEVLPNIIQAIWHGGLRAHGFDPAPAPDFERYDGRFDPETRSGIVEIWIPIRSSEG